MMIPPSDQPNTDPALPPQRQDRLNSHSGKFSGIAELSSFDMPSLDKEISSQKESSRNDTTGDCDHSNVPDSSLPLKAKHWVLVVFLLSEVRCSQGIPGATS
jgi:hypothetical protein